MMEKVEVVLSQNNFGEIQLYSDGIKAGEMAISVSNGLLTIYHTEVSEAYNGRGFAKILLDKAVSYARENGLMIVPLCPYVHAQFKRRPDDYQDIWYRGELR